MKVNHYQAVEPQPVIKEGASGCRVRGLVGPADGAPNFAMREFEIEPGGYTPRHSHPYEHEVFVLEGAGEVYEGDTAHPLRAGDVIYVAPNDVHQFRNTGPGRMRFLCMVPNSAAKLPVTAAPECSLVAAKRSS
jgi:quercetin dioxygenase-like cupin family protein